MSLTKRLKRLEKAVGKGEPCAMCRLILRSSPPVSVTQATLRASDKHVRKTCIFCGNSYYAPLPEGDSSRDRVLRLYYSYKEEDIYTDEKACAVFVWVRQRGNRLPEESARKAKRRTAATNRRGEKPTPEQKLLQQLNEELRELFRRWRKKVKAKYDKPFPHIFKLEGVIARGFYDWMPASHELERWQAWATLEKIIFGEPLPETMVHITEYEEKIVAEEEEKQRKEVEMLGREERLNSIGARYPYQYPR